MPGELPEDPPVREMLEWMMSTWGMTKSDLARMFQRTQSTIHHWLNTGQVSHRNLMKIRSSYYFLHDARDPHANERKCERCGKWLPQKEFRAGKGHLPFLRELADSPVLLDAPRRAAHQAQGQELVQPPDRELVDTDARGAEGARRRRVRCGQREPRGRQRRLPPWATAAAALEGRRRRP